MPADTPVLAVYPGTFDPITLGHQDIIHRACRLFDRVLVAVAISENKTTLFNIDEREALVKTVLAGQQKVQICRLDTLVVDLARSRGAKVIVRGLRAVSDFDYEFQMAMMNQRLNDEVETLFLTPSEAHCSLSASLIKEIASLSGSVAPFVHQEVEAALVRKMQAR